MEWNTFEESKTELPEVVVEKLIEGFSNATKDLAHLSITEHSEMERLVSGKINTRFQFKLLLSSRHLPDYSFTVLEFGYDVNLYPVKVLISRSILEELKNKNESYSNIQSFDSEEKFQKAVMLIFSTEAFTQVVSGLMKIASRHNDF